MSKPLIHCITNPISMNQCANAILAMGARPIMAEHPKEVEEITATASGLMLNLGNITDIRMESMEKSLGIANEKGIPVVIDAVGIACSELRLEFLKRLLVSKKADVIKGNYSEILALNDDSYRASGVDAEENLSIEKIKEVAKSMAEKYDSVILATGAVDIVATKDSVQELHGGCKQMGQATGTGCMLGAIITTLVSQENNVDKVIEAVRFFGECGQRATTEKGVGSFMVNLLDEIGGYDGI